MRGKKSAGTRRILFGMIILLNILNDATAEDQERASIAVPKLNKADGDSNTTDIHLSSYNNVTTASTRDNTKNQNEIQITLWISLAYLGGVVSGCILGVMISYVINIKKCSQCRPSKDANEQEAAEPMLVKSSDNKESVRNEYSDTKPTEEHLYLDVIVGDKGMKGDVEKGESQAEQTEGKTRDPITHTSTDDTRDPSLDRSPNSPTGDIYKNQRFFNKDVRSTTGKSSSKLKVKDETIKPEKLKAQKKESDTEPSNLSADQEKGSDQFYVNVDHKEKPQRLKPRVARKPSFLSRVLHKRKTLEPRDKPYEQLGRESMPGPSNTCDLYEPLQRGTI